MLKLIIIFTFFTQPVGSIMKKILENQKSIGKRMYSVYGKPESEDKTSGVPVVHPQLCVSVDHFKRNTMYLDDKYRPLDEQLAAYKDAPRASYADLEG